jgi:hypothetical protein
MSWVVVLSFWHDAASSNKYRYFCLYGTETTWFDIIPAFCELAHQVPLTLLVLVGTSRSTACEHMEHRRKCDMSTPTSHHIYTYMFMIYMDTMAKPDGAALNMRVSIDGL